MRTPQAGPSATVYFSSAGREVSRLGAGRAGRQGEVLVGEGRGRKVERMAQCESVKTFESVVGCSEDWKRVGGDVELGVVWKCVEVCECVEEYGVCDRECRLCEGVEK